MKSSATGKYLLVIIFLLILISESKVVYASSGRMIDLYTQKEPFSGKGPNQPSDAFAPLAEVILYAKVTYNDMPQESMLVSFQVVNPLSETYHVEAAFTSEDGIATVSFRLPDGGNETVFGVWSVIATVDIAGETVMDTLTFRFGWIVRIVSLKTLNRTLQPQTRFAKGTHLCVQVVLGNIAMLPKKVTLSISVFDAMKTPIISAIDDFEVNSSDVNTYTICSLQIPEWSAVGDATVSASAFTAPVAEGGVPYCPQVSATLLITLQGDLNYDGEVDMQDVYIVIHAFGSYLGHPKWNPIADIDGDDQVDIRDIYLVIKNFGEEDP